MPRFTHSAWRWNSGNGPGLARMRERPKRVGYELIIQSSVGKTIVGAAIPCQWGDTD
jgi:hypothetical protein